MSASSPFDTLSSLLPALKRHMPEMGVLISELISELRMAEKLKVIDARSSLHTDAENLAAQLSVVLEMRSLGVTNDDIEAAESALTTLALDMRARTSVRIRDKTSMIRVNAEVSAHRADPDIHAMDITQGYRLMAAIPASVHDVEDALVVKNIGLPAHGGIPGKIVGDVLLADVPEENETYFKNSAPTETFYLPAGRTVRLRKGDMIRVHHQGLIEDAEITLSTFDDNLAAVDVEAAADEVVLHGPLTFALSREELISDMQMQIMTYERAMGKKPLFSNLGETDYKGMAILSIPVSSGVMICYVLSRDNPSFLISAALSFSSVYVPLAIGVIQKLGHIRFLRKIRGCHKDKMCDVHERLGSQSSSEFYQDQIDAISDAKSRISSASVLRMFAARSVIVKASRGIQTIEPLKALAPPVQEVDLGLGTSTARPKERA